MSTIKADTVQPKDFATDITLGASGDTVTLPGNDLRVNTVADKGGNTLWTSDGSGTLSSVNAGLKGNLSLLTTNTFTNTVSSSFTTKIDSTYDVYIFKFTDIHNDVDGDNFAFNCSIDGGSNYNVTKTTTYFRAQHYENDGAAGLSYLTNRDRAQSTAAQWLAESMGNAANKSLSGELYLFNPSSTTFVKHFYATTVDRSNNDYCHNAFIAGYFNTTSAINAISFFSDGGSPAIDGTIKMYGLL